MPQNFTAVPLTPEATFSLEQGGALVRRTVLPGGIRVTTEQLPGIRSAALGLWVGAGSRDEDDTHAGSTHFLEHLLFKGTATRDAADIAQAFDAVGGEANAATAKNYTCYYARVIDDDLPLAIDVLMDMVTSSRLDPQDMELERGVILDELAMAADDPSDVVHEAFTARVLSPHPLARPIGGTSQSVTALTRQAVWGHYRAVYRPEELVVTAAGSLDHDAVCAAVVAAARRAGWELHEGVAPAARRTGAAVQYAPADHHRIERPVEQAHVIVGGPGLNSLDPRRFALAVASTALGGGMSSRLFQEVRERRGLAYSTYSFTSSYAEGGLFGAYAACAPQRTQQVQEILRQQLQDLGSIDAAEVARAIGQITGGFVLGSEDSYARMTRLGISELVTGTLYSLEETLRRYRAVTVEDVRAVAADVFAAPPSAVVVGPA